MEFRSKSALQDKYKVSHQDLVAVLTFPSYPSKV